MGRGRLHIARTWLVAAAATAGLTGASAPVPDAVPIPGYWETTNTATFIFSSKSVELKCFTAADVSKVLQGPSNRHYACTYPTRVVGDGRILLKGTCVTKKGQVARISARGVYAPTTFHLTADLKTKIGGMPLAGSASTDARRISDTCPADSPPP